MATEAELEARFERLRADLMAIDEQLALRRQAISDWDDEHRAWRRRAITAKARKTEEIVLVKKRLLALQKRRTD